MLRRPGRCLVDLDQLGTALEAVDAYSEDQLTQHTTQRTSSHNIQADMVMPYPDSQGQDAHLAHFEGGHDPHHGLLWPPCAASAVEVL